MPAAQRENKMAASSRLVITEAERRFPCRIKLAVPAGGLGARLTEMQAWLDDNCGADGWAMTPAGLRGVVNDAVAGYFLDATSGAAFMPRWCAGSKLEISDGAFQVREDQPTMRVAAAPHLFPVVKQIGDAKAQYRSLPSRGPIPGRSNDSRPRRLARRGARSYPHPSHRGQEPRQGPRVADGPTPCFSRRRSRKQLADVQRRAPHSINPLVATTSA